MSDEPAKPDSGAGAPASLGARLKTAREAQGLRAETAAEALGFACGIVIALEADDYARLGPPVYVRGYLRKYARYLDLPGDELVAAYERGAAPREPDLKSGLSPIAAPPRRAGRWVAGVVTVLVIAVLVVAGIFAWHYYRRTQVARIPPAAAASAIPALAQTPLRGADRKGLTAATRPATRVGAAATAGSVAALAPASQGTAEAAPGQPQLVLRVHDASWIEVVAADQTRLYYNLAETGKTLDFDGRHGALTVYLGNAPGVSVEVNGRPYPIPAAARSGHTARFKVTLAKAPATAPEM